jgi:4-hydroxy-2-oxoheptanedioate aldolase
MLAHLQTIAAYDSQPVCRVPVGDTALIKQYLDLGVPNLLVPMVDTPEQARALAQACRYPPRGIRGMAGARASRWGRIPGYAQQANAQICLLVQAETRLAMSNLDAILAVEGIDGVFIGSADLSASLGHAGDAGHAEVQSVIEYAIVRIRKAGKAPGILTVDLALSRHYLELGALFVAVGLDTQLLVRGTTELLSQFRTLATAPLEHGDKTYG